ncbi:MAG: serine/threonine-protein kinase, partial [Pseudomonadota bacterium]
MTSLVTICPCCESKGGELASACDNPVCSKKGYHFIPEDHFSRHCDRAKQSGEREDPEVGRVIERYLVVEKLGEGGMGAVYLALQLPLKKQVALKMIAGISLDDHSRKRFEREATAISSLYHPNIVSLIDYGVRPDTGAPFMALEFVRNGKELSQLMIEKMKKREKWKKDDLINIFTQILNGLGVAHKSGLIHRDIKPQNIMLADVEGNPFFVNLLDFGLVRALEDLPGLETLTTEGAVVGTPQYMAPEQVAGAGELDHRVDLYAVGAILYEMVTGRASCPGKTTREIFYTKLSPDFDPMKDVRPGSVEPAIEKLLDKALKRNPEERFSSAREMKEALVEAMGGVKEDYLQEEVEAMSHAPTVASDSFKDPGLPTPPVQSAAGAGAIEERPGEATKQAGSLMCSIEQGVKKKKTSIMWAGAVLAAAVAVIAAVLFGPWSRPGGGPEGEGEKAASPAAQAVGGEQESADYQEILERRKAERAGERGGEAAVDEAGGGEGTKKAQEDKAAEAEEEKPRKKIPKIPQSPPKAVVDAQIAKLRKMVEACAEGYEGELEMHVTFEGWDGRVHPLFSQGTLNMTPAKKCFSKAAYTLEVGKFKDFNHTV